MKFLKKLKRKLKGEVDMTPLEPTPMKDFVDLREIKSKYQEPKEEEKYSPELIKKFEEEFPGKHAVWRGNYTKQFTSWAEKQNDS